MPFLFVLAILGAAPEPHPKMINVITGLAIEMMAEGRDATPLEEAVRYCAGVVSEKVPELPASYAGGPDVDVETSQRAVGIAAACMEGERWIITNTMLRLLAQKSRRP